MLLKPESGLLFWMLLSFGIAFFILAKYGFPVITKMIEKRGQYIEESLKEAHQANEQLVSINEQKEQILAAAKAEQVRILKEADDTRNRIINEAKQAAIEAGKKEMEEMKKQIEIEKQHAINEIRQQVAEISVDIAQKILRENLDSSKNQMSMIERLVDEAMVSKS